MKNLYVGNLPHSTTEPELRGLFEAHGAVERVSIVTDRETGRARGFGFVEMTDAAEGDKAVAALNGTELRRKRPEDQRGKTKDRRSARRRRRRKALFRFRAAAPATIMGARAASPMLVAELHPRGSATDERNSEAGSSPWQSGAVCRCLIRRL